MTRKEILLFIAGLAISLMISAVVYWCLFLETIELFGIDSIRNPESRHGTILLTATSTTVLTLLAAAFFRKVKYAAIGFAIPSLIGIYIMILVGPTYLDKSSYYEPFDRNRWLTQEDDRLKMARQLIRSRELNNLTRTQVIEKLGPGHFEHDYLNYKIWGDDSGLEILFLNDKVSKSLIYVKD